MIRLPGMETVLHNLLAILPPFVAIVEDVDVAPRLEAEPRLPQLSPHLHLPLVCRRCVPPPATPREKPEISSLEWIDHTTISTNNRADID